MNGKTFREQLREDMKTTFLNPGEFGELHTVNGKKMRIIIDDNELVVRKKGAKSHMDGVYKKQTLAYVSALDFGPLPGVGKVIKIDGKAFLITDSINECGVYSLQLEANKI